MKPQLIIFDCDGVLVDSEPLSNRIIAEELTRLGLPMNTTEALHLFAGGSLSRVQEYYKKVMGETLPESFDPTYRQRSHQLFAEELEAIEGVEKALAGIAFRKCVGSNGPLDKIEFNLTKTGLRDHFGDYLFSAYEIGYWKPLPHLYQHAALKMGVAPEQCVVVEDSVHGVQAAVAAGMRVLGYSGTTSAEILAKEGAEVFHSMLELPDLLENY